MLQALPVLDFVLRTSLEQYLSSSEVATLRSLRSSRLRASPCARTITGPIFFERSPAPRDGVEKSSNLIPPEAGLEHYYSYRSTDGWAYSEA